MVWCICFIFGHLDPEGACLDICIIEGLGLADGVDCGWWQLIPELEVSGRFGLDQVAPLEL